MPRQFEDFVATELYCPRCQRAQRVRERLLLVLPTGEIHEYLCAQCAASLGKRTITGPGPRLVVAPGSRAGPMRKR
jgi:hypothetical protein